MASTPINSIFDGAKWFLDRGEEQNEYLQPLKLNGLIYLSQAYYAGLKAGAKLMPAFFVAHDLGPVDPNLYRALEQRQLNVFYEPVVGEALLLIKSVWKKYGSMPTNQLTKELKSHAPYKNSYNPKIRNNEIPLIEMAKFYGNLNKPKKEVGKPKFLRTQNGDVVNVTQWMPKKKGI
ncbi:MAG: hypothetical protein BWY78_01392 [Alphaproteobacteria bacterium ADurb.Bin438]|nr:MAG: hypothetical protein BWY78_01392 [Alphaproteobacteria bacterium ADurb.Bin438]